MRKYSKAPKVLKKKIKKLREEKGYTQEDLGEIIGVTSTYIGFIEQGRKVPSIKTTNKIAKALGVKFADLFE